MKEFLRNNAFFCTCWLLVLLAMVTALVVVPKAELHMALNAWHCPALDVFFRYYTQFVQWPVYVLMLLPLLGLLPRWKGKECLKPIWTALFAAAEALSALISQLIKHIWNMPRPKTFFEDLQEYVLPVVEGVHMHSWHSFPSGHTASFFVFFSLCAFIYAGEGRPYKHLFGFMCLILALLGGYSRIYLSQHFLLDVCVGMVNGTLVSAAVYVFFSAKNFFIHSNKANLCSAK